MLGPDADWPTRLLAASSVPDDHGRPTLAPLRRQDAAAVALLDPYTARTDLGRLGGPAAERLAPLWERRTAAARRFAAALRDVGTPDRVLGSVLHMHANRLLGVDRDAETEAMTILRAGVRVHHDRRRFS
ncbi:lantibiotic dehydratase C-terminal domain-containing protein [Streptomyces sp. NPDC001780]